MARNPRVEFARAFYHVICRGNQRQVIFRSDAGSQVLSGAARAISRAKWLQGLCVCSHEQPRAL